MVIEEEQAWPKAICMLTLVWMPLKEVRHFFDRDHVEYVLYHACSTGFELLGDVFLI